MIGRIILAAEQEGDHILLSITDDGGGMDPEKLRGLAVEKGLFDEDAAEPGELFYFITHVPLTRYYSRSGISAIPGMIT